MTRYTHELTATEIACGVTLDRVADELPRVLVRDHRVHIASDLSPALATSVARAAFGTADFEFIGIGKNTGYFIYERSR